MQFPTPRALECQRLFELCLGALKGDKCCRYPWSSGSKVWINTVDATAIFVDVRSFSDEIVEQIRLALDNSDWSAKLEMVQCHPAGLLEKGSFHVKLLVIKPRPDPNH